MAMIGMPRIPLLLWPREIPEKRPSLTIVLGRSSQRPKNSLPLGQRRKLSRPPVIVIPDSYRHAGTSSWDLGSSRAERASTNAFAEDAIAEAASPGSVAK